MPSPPLPSTTPVDLFLIAGLPNPQHARAEAYLKGLAGSCAKVIAVASANDDGPLFRKSAVESLLRAATKFAIRRLKNRSNEQSAQPRRIVLFYVPAEDDERLLHAFDFFVFPVRMRDLASFDETGRQRRHQRTTCEQAVKKAFDAYKHELVGVIQPRIESRKSSEPLLLPPLNFHLPGRPLQNAFCELSRGARAWKNAVPEGIVAVMFDSEMLPAFLKPQERQLIFRDARGVVFPSARAGEMHGQIQEVEPDGDMSTLREVLRSTYRFGASLPFGFHHDAQYEGGRTLRNVSFQCSRKGLISVTSTHANIYPNDYVRPGT